MFIGEGEYTLEGLSVRHKIVWPNDKVHSNESFYDVQISCNSNKGSYTTIVLTQNEWMALKHTIEMGRSL